MKITIGIDTSNYTTSAAAADENGRIISDVRRLLTVKEGERGLRQSHALFQHVTNLPEITEQLMKEVRAAEKIAESGEKYEICAVAASTTPRPVEGSYMPVFLAGSGAARSLAAALNVPFFQFSHQEGHIAAVCGAYGIDTDKDKGENTETGSGNESEFLSFHLSGGTGEIVRVKGCMPLDIVGGIRDISFGQVLDRTGVAAGFEFPAGARLDGIACENKKKIDVRFSSRGKMIIEGAVLKPIHVDGAYADLSGIETQVQQALKKGVPIEKLAPELFFWMSEALTRMVSAAGAASGLERVVFAGGVSASSFIREELEKRLPKMGIEVSFGAPELSSDNACGIARLGMKVYLNS